MDGKIEGLLAAHLRAAFFKDLPFAFQTISYKIPSSPLWDAKLNFVMCTGCK